MFRRSIVRFALLIIACFLVVATALAVIFVEPKNAAREDWSYKLGFPDAAKFIPLFDSCAPARFSHVGRDGEAAPATEITYLSTETASALEEFYRVYLGELGCVGDNLVNTTCNTRSYSIEIEEQNDCRAVKILVVGDF